MVLCSVWPMLYQGWFSLHDSSWHGEILPTWHLLPSGMLVLTMHIWGERAVGIRWVTLWRIHYFGSLVGYVLPSIITSLLPKIALFETGWFQNWVLKFSPCSSRKHGRRQYLDLVLPCNIWLWTRHAIHKPYISALNTELQEMKFSDQKFKPSRGGLVQL